MITLLQVLVFALVLAGGWFVWSSLKARETANAAMRAACAAQGLLFLDDTVALQSVRPARDDNGQMRLRRVFGFEYSDTGHDRRPGRLTLLGDVVIEVEVGALSAEARDTLA